jgi:hypothetical protein
MKHNLATLNERHLWEVGDFKGVLHIASGDHVMVEVFALIGSAAGKARPENAVYIAPKVLEFKHYRKGGGKFWTAKAGMVFGFVIPKIAIDLILDKPTYSYVPAEIGGETFVLNVTGGTGGKDGWFDYISRSLSVCGTITRKRLAVLDKAALSPVASRLLGMTCSNRQEDDCGESLKRILAREITLKPGMKIALYHCSVGGKTDGFEIAEMGRKKWSGRREQAVYLSGGYHTPSLIRCKLNQIDWIKTAEANGIKVEIPAAEYRLPATPEVAAG